MVVSLADRERDKMAKKKQAAANKKVREKSPLVMVFGEDDNDRSSIKYLIRALAPQCPTIRTYAKPLVLVRNRAAAEQRKNAGDIHRVVAAAQVMHKVEAVFAHEDCDAVEPAHVALSDQIEQQLLDQGVPNPCAVTPAWELEAWWFLWPDAVQKVNRNWRRLNRDGSAVGLIVDAKETLRRDLRPQGKGNSTSDYQESDSPTIAKFVHDDGLIGDRKATSQSFDRFMSRVLELYPPSAKE